AEASLIYKSLVVEPFCDGQAIRFAIRNNGNADLDLIMLEAWCPSEVVNMQRHVPGVRNLLEFRGESIDNSSYRYCCYTTAIIENSHVPALRSVLTPSMGILVLEQPIFPLLPIPPARLDKLSFYHHIHARSYDTQRERMALADVIKKTQGA